MTGTYQKEMDDISQLDTKLLVDLLRRYTETESTEITPQHSDDNYKHHIDLYWTYNGKRIGIDVKGYKFQKRADKDALGNRIDRLKQTQDYDVVWLEKKNNAGMDGWIVPKDDGPDYIAFRHPKCFVLVKPKHLNNLWNEKIQDGNSYVTTTPQDYYVPYKREKYGHDDLTAKFKFEDLIELLENGKAKILEY